MKKAISLALLIILLTAPATAKYVMPGDERDQNFPEYSRTGEIDKTPTSYEVAKSPPLLESLNWVFASYKNINLTSDGNITITPLPTTSEIKIGLSPDVNLTTVNISDLNGGDANFIHIGADNFFGGSFYGTFFGDGSNLTGIASTADINAQFVPYIDAVADVNLGVYDLTADDLNAINLGIESDTHFLGNVWAPFIQTGMDGPTGFPNKCSDVIISFTDGTNTFSIQPSGASFSVFHSGIEFTKTAEETLVTTDDEGAHYIYYDASGSLVEKVTPSDTELQDIIRDEAEIVALYWNTTADQNIYFTGTNECHGTKMDGASHAHHHFVHGTLFDSGLAVGDITADDTGDNDLHAQISLTNGSIRDEDISQTITDDSPQNLSLPANLPIFYRSGASNWRKIAATNFPVTTTGSGRAAWNEFTGGVWQLTEVGNTDFVLSHIFATNNFYEPVVVIVGQADYATQTAAREGAATEINSLITSGIGFQEFVPIATIIFQTNNGYSNAVKSRIRTTDIGDDYIDWRFQQITPSIVPGSVLNLTDIGTDFAPQYVLDAGDTITGDLNVNEDLNVGQDLNVIGNAQFRMDVNIWGSLNIAGTTLGFDSNFVNVGISGTLYADDINGVVMDYDLNNTFIPYIGAVKNVNLGGKAFSTGGGDITNDNITLDGSRIEGSSAITIAPSNHSDDAMSVALSAGDIVLDTGGSADLFIMADSYLYLEPDFEIRLRPDNDVDDYIEIETISNRTNLNFVGQDGNITATGGDISFDDDNTITTGTGTFGELIVDNIMIDGETISQPIGDMTISSGDDIAIIPSNAASVYVGGAIGSAVRIKDENILNVDSIVFKITDHPLIDLRGSTLVGSNGEDLAITADDEVTIKGTDIHVGTGSDTIDIDASTWGVSTTGDANFVDMGISGNVFGTSGGDLNIQSDTNFTGTVKANKFMSTDANSAFGIASTALGSKTTAFGDYATSLGYQTTASGTGSIAMGYGTNAGSVWADEKGAIAIGSTVTTGKVQAIGQSAIAIGLGSAEGTVKANSGGIAIGTAVLKNLYAASTGSIAIGFSGVASGLQAAGGVGAVALGVETKAFGRGAVSIGDDTNARGNGAIAIGKSCNARTVNAVCIGNDLDAFNANQVVIEDLNVQDDAWVYGDLNVVGDIHTPSNVFGAAFLDATPAYEGTSQTALNELAAIASKDGQIDHTTLPSFTVVQMPVYETVYTEKCEMKTDYTPCFELAEPPEDLEKCSQQIEQCSTIQEQVLTGYKDTRSLGAMITMQVEAIKALKTQNEELKDALCKYHPEDAICLVATP